MESLFEAKETGRLHVRLKEVVERNKITCNKLSTLTGIKNEVLKRYWEGQSLKKLDAGVIERICECLKCDISDMVYFVPWDKMKPEDKKGDEKCRITIPNSWF